jgi:hypothetical protein
MNSLARTPFLRLVALAAAAGRLAARLAAPRTASAAQGITLPPNGENPQASVMQAIGPVRVTIDYSSPRVVPREPGPARARSGASSFPGGSPTSA